MALWVLVAILVSSPFVGYGIVAFLASILRFGIRRDETH
jgi:hypothetical protein